MRSIKKLSDAEEKAIFGGQLGEYKYYDMDQVIAATLYTCDTIFDLKEWRICMQEYGMCNIDNT